MSSFIYTYISYAFSDVQLFAVPWTVAHQSCLSVEFSRQEYWSGLPFSSPGDHPNPGIKLRSPALQADSLLSKLSGNLHAAIFLSSQASTRESNAANYRAHALWCLHNTTRERSSCTATKDSTCHSEGSHMQQLRPTQAKRKQTLKNKIKFLFHAQKQTIFMLFSPYTLTSLLLLYIFFLLFQFSSVHFSHSVMFDSL